MSAHLLAVLDRFDRHAPRRATTAVRTTTPRLDLEDDAAPLPGRDLIERARRARTPPANASRAWQERGYTDRDAWERLEFDPFAEPPHNDDTDAANRTDATASTTDSQR